MKIAAIADVHANLAALSAALSDIRSEGIDHLIVGGDLVGYYFQPSEVFDALEDWNAIYVRGNHEDMLQLKSTLTAGERKVQRKLMAFEQCNSCQQQGQAPQQKRHDNRLKQVH